MMNTSVSWSSLFCVADLEVRELGGVVVQLVSPGGGLWRIFGLLLETQCLGPLECR